MNVECPSCHLAGKVNELELPPLGRELTCPRCKTSFHVDKPATLPGDARATMNTCPACQYSTFTEEMFAVCPKCGMTAAAYQVLAQKKLEREQAARDQEALHRNYRNPDLVSAPVEESTAEPPKPTQAVEVTAWLCMVAGGTLLVYGSFGLGNYYSKDWQAILSEPVLEPVSKFSVFVRLGLIPWTATVTSCYLVWAAHQFWKLRKDSLSRLMEAAWCGIAAATIYEAVAFGDWVRLSSSTPTFSYYAVGLLSSLFWTALFSAPFVVLLRYLKSKGFQKEFRKAQFRSHNG